jgi:gamma-glutamyltranspeptidase/glutathione hydrolase
MLMVIGMQHSGIGGGGFMLVRDSDGKYESIGTGMMISQLTFTNMLADFRETAPANASEDMYQGNWMGSVTSGLASAVPGDVKGLEYLHKKYGVSYETRVGECC